MQGITKFSEPLNTSLDNPLWQFACLLWAKPGAEAAALCLQDAGWQVSHLLVALWCAKQGHRWDGLEPAHIAAWRMQYTIPLRQLRRSLPKTPGSLAQLRQQLANSELLAERIELAWWHQHLNQHGDKPTADPARHLTQDPAHHLTHNLAHPLAQAVYTNLMLTAPVDQRPVTSRITANALSQLADLITPALPEDAFLSA